MRVCVFTFLIYITSCTKTLTRVGAMGKNCTSGRSSELRSAGYAPPPYHKTELVGTISLCVDAK